MSRSLLSAALLSHRALAAALMGAGVGAVAAGAYVQWGAGVSLITAGVLLILLSLLTGWE